MRIEMKKKFETLTRLNAAFSVGDLVTCETYGDAACLVGIVVEVRWNGLVRAHMAGVGDQWFNERDRPLRKVI